jgi:hypothetical protein
LISGRVLAEAIGSAINAQGATMSLLVVFLVTLLIGQALSIGAGLLVERHTTPYTGLITFIVSYFAVFWLAWMFAVRITAPGSRFGSRLARAESDPPTSA